MRPDQHRCQAEDIVYGPPGPQIEDRCTVCGRRWLLFPPVKGKPGSGDVRTYPITPSMPRA